MTDSSSKLLRIHGRWYQERKPTKNPKPEPKKTPKTILHPFQWRLKQLFPYILPTLCLHPTRAGTNCPVELSCKRRCWPGGVWKYTCVPGASDINLGGRLRAFNATRNLSWESSQWKAEMAACRICSILLVGFFIMRDHTVGAQPNFPSSNLLHQ
jgi:hypothetical protein